MDLSYQVLAAKYIRRQAKQLAEQLDGVCKAEDIEFVHRARVASRRLRAALKMFRGCFGGKRVKRWRKQIRHVTSELGDARDIDVQIEFLCGALHGVQQPACYPGIARLLVQLEQRRGLLQTSVISAVNRLRASGVLDDMQSVAKKILADPRSEYVSVQSLCARYETERHIRRRLKKVFRYEKSLSDADDLQRHHAMRIAAKRLRYTLEIAKPVYEKQLDTMVEAVKRVQTLLGDIHDCDVWLGRLEAFAAAERENVLAQFGSAGPFGRLNVGIEYLREDRCKHRAKVFQELVAYWEQLKQQALWENLLGIVAARLQAAAKPQSPAAALLAVERSSPAEALPAVTPAETALSAETASTSAAASPAEASLPAALLPTASELPPPHWQKFASTEPCENRISTSRPKAQPLGEALRQPKAAFPPASAAPTVVR